MFNFFKRSDKESNGLVASPRNQTRKTSVSRGVDTLEPLPVPQVVEGNEDSDWAMWEDSVLEQDSHPPTQYADTTPSQLDSEPNTAMGMDVDPFAQVTRKAP